MQIRTKLTLQFVSISAFILLVSLASIYYFSEKKRETEFFTQLRNKAVTTADLLIKVQEVDSTLLKTIDKRKKDVLELENISIYNYQNKEIYTNNDTIKFETIIADVDETINEIRLYGEIRFSINDMEIMGIPYIDRFNRFVVLAGAIDKEGQSNIRNLKQLLILVFVCMLIAVAISGWIYSGRALKPISNVINQVNDISVKKLGLRLNEGNRTDEIAKLSQTFNRMLDRLESAFKIQKTFISNASHELKTPLTKITSQLEVALLKNRDTEEYKKTISSVLEDIKSLNEITHQLLELDKISTAETSLKSVRIDEVIWEAKTKFIEQHPHCKVNLFIQELPPDEQSLFVDGNTQLLHVCFINLMENSCKFSPDKSVDVKLRIADQYATLHFENYGEGISTADLPYIFEPFFRSKNSANHAGYGIGLSLVKKIVLAHNAQITVKSIPNDKTVFTIIFKIRKNEF